MRDGESEEDDEPIANKLDGEVEGTTATEAKPPGEVNAESAKREPAAPQAHGISSSRRADADCDFARGRRGRLGFSRRCLALRRAVERIDSALAN